MGTTVAANGVLEEVYKVKLRPQHRAEAERAAHLLQDTKVRRDLVLAAPDHEPVHMPAEAVSLIAMVLRAVLKGHSIAVLAPPDAVISTSTAARLLGVSRPHVAKLVDTGLLPASKPGAHRRLRIADVLAYHERVQGRHAALDALVAETEALGLYGTPPKHRKATKGTIKRAARAAR